MERIWHHLWMKELQVGVKTLNPKEEKKKVVAGDHPILMTECPLNPKKNRERAAEILFDR